jgi:hypothetical protein
MAVVVGGAALALGATVCFQGARLLRYVIPVLAFIAGGALGAEVVSLVYGTHFLTTVPSVVVALVVGLIFAAVSNAHYHWTIIGLSALIGLVVGSVWLTVTGHGMLGVPGGLALAVVFALLAVIGPQVVVAVATAAPGAMLALGGALVIGGSISVGRGGLATTVHAPLAWVVGWLVIAGAGTAAQLRTVPPKAP